MHSSKPMSQFSPLLVLKPHFSAQEFSHIQSITNPKQLYSKLTSYLSVDFLGENEESTMLKRTNSLECCLISLINKSKLLFSGAEVAEMIEECSVALTQYEDTRLQEIIVNLVKFRIVAEIAKRNQKVLGIVLLALEAVDQEIETQNSIALMILFYNLKLASELLQPSCLNFSFLRSFTYLLENLSTFLKKLDNNLGEFIFRKKIKRQGAIVQVLRVGQTLCTKFSQFDASDIILQPVVKKLEQIKEKIATQGEAKEIAVRIEELGGEKEKTPLRLQSLDPYIAPEFITWMPREDRLKNTLSVNEQQRRLKRTIKAEERAVMRQLKKDTQTLGRQREKEAEEEKEKQKGERARVRRIMEEEVLMIKKWKTEQAPVRGPKREKKKRMAGNQTEQKK